MVLAIPRPLGFVDGIDFGRRCWVWGCAWMIGCLCGWKLLFLVLVEVAMLEIVGCLLFERGVFVIGSCEVLSAEKAIAEFQA